MDAVKLFNAELSSLYEVRPPISKAKMTAITRGAIKAIKFYKHVVQSVEKFILKCKPEYKVPGLYVIDSIVRQSRHQFGADKDVFAPRFAKNIQQTFLNLFKCPPEDKSKVIRVLNLWQKNQVFAPDVIQPLFDLADPNNPIHKELAATTTPLQSNGMNSSSAAMVKGSPALQKTPTKGSQQGNDGSHLGGTNLNLSDPNVLAQLQRLLQRTGDSSAKSEGPVHFDRKLLDFDYGDDDDEAHSTPKQPPAPPANESVASLLTNPEVLRQLQTLQQTMTSSVQNDMVDIDKLRKLQEMKQQEEEFDKHLAQTVPNLPFASECDFKPGTGGYFMPSNADLSQPPPGYKSQASSYGELPQPPSFNDSDQFGLVQNENGDEVAVINLDHVDSRSPSPDDRYTRSRRRSRSRSRERGRDRRSRRSRSRSRSRTRRHRSRSRERNKTKEKETERDRERKKRGLPVIKKDNLSVCSTTLWVGHLSKLVHQEDLSNTFGEFGDIVSIDLIPPRGCAFIVMHRRQDAARCLTKLKNHILHGKAITLAWAPGKGVKGKDLKDYWEGDLGVSYIPWNKLKPDIDIEMLEDGGMIDEETMPPWMKAKLLSQQSSNISNNNSTLLEASSGFPQMDRPLDTSQPPPVPGSGLLQPPPMALPMVSPFQFNNRLLGPVGMLPPNIPIGVPPPQIPSLMQNSLVGLGSPFQTTPSLIPPPHQLPVPSQTATDDKNSSDLLMGAAASQFTSMMASQALPSASAPSNDDNMDIEMEDAEKERQPLLSEQLEASINFRQRDDERRNFRDRYNRERDEDGRGRNNRRKEEDRDRRDRPNRWSDRDESVERIDRREREKSLNDRLQQMANQDYTPNHERSSQRDFPPLEGPPSDMNEWLEQPQDEYNDSFDPPPPLHGMPQRMHRDDFDPTPPPLQERFLRGGRGRGDFRDRSRGGPPPQDFFSSRDNFGPRGPPPLMRNGPPGEFGPRGPPPMMRGPGPHKFHPRGPLPMRGPRPSMHRGNFGPRFDHPPDFYRGGPHGGNFDDTPPPHVRHRNNRYDDRRRPPRDFHENEERFLERRNSRWGAHSPKNPEQNQEDNVNEVQSQPPPPPPPPPPPSTLATEENDKSGSGGECTTPLHDEDVCQKTDEQDGETLCEENNN